VCNIDRREHIRPLTCCNKSLDARKAHEMYIYITLYLTKLYSVYIKKELYYNIVLYEYDTMCLLVL